MKIHVFESEREAAAAAAAAVARRLEEAPDSVLMMPTGDTMLAMYRELVGLHERGGVSFARASIFNLDEYLGLSAKHPASFASYMRENFFSRVDAEPERTRIPDGATRDPARECESYEREMQAAGGVDLCLLGIGKNGHVGFNEPGAPFSSRTRVVRLSESTREANGAGFPGGLSPEKALTAGVGTILDSREILLLATGEDKAEAVAASVEGRVSEEVPASALQGHPACAFLLDATAADLLNE